MIASRDGLARSRRAVLAIFWRDVFVTGKEFWGLLVQVALMPLFMLFVFAEVLGSMGYISAEYGSLLLPGILALSAFLTALQSVALPLVMEFGWSKEIEDRLLAPLPIWLVAVEKLVIATLRGLLSALLILPAGVALLGGAPWRAEGLPLLCAVLLLGGWVGAAIGITMGTLVPSSRIGIALGALLTPLVFTGATYYPWAALEGMPWFQVVTALNPLTYAAEGARAAMVPSTSHVASWVCLTVLTVTAGGFTVAGLRGFQRRAVG